MLYVKINKTMQETCRSLYSQISTREIRNVNHTGLSLQREGSLTCLLPRSLGMQVVNRLLSVRPNHTQILPTSLFLSSTHLSQSIYSTISLPYTLIKSIVYLEFSPDKVFLLVYRNYLDGRCPLYFTSLSSNHVLSFFMHMGLMGLS